MVSSFPGFPTKILYVSDFFTCADLTTGLVYTFYTFLISLLNMAISIRAAMGDASSKTFLPKDKRKTNLSPALNYPDIRTYGGVEL
jgi:hypothetical protein